MFPQQQPQRKPIMAPAIASQNEAQAKEKLSGYVYEYLIHVGAPKAAEIFKSEILAHQNLTQIAPGEPPGFLHNWWCVFWDLYSAAPERRDKYDPSQEAKAFHEYGFIPPSVFPPNHMMNGIHPASQFLNGSGPALNSMAIPNPSDAIIPNYFANRNNNQSVPSNNQSNQASPIAAGARYVGAHSGVGVPSAGAGARSGAPTPSNVMGAGPNGPNFAGPPGMFSADQMRNIAVQRMNSNTRIPNFGPMRQVMRSGGFGPGPSGPFLESPSGTPPFGQNPGMMQNSMCPTASLMSSPNNQQNSNPSVPQSLNPEGSTHDPRFMMMSGTPAQFSINHHDGAGTPTSCANSNNFNNNGLQLNANNTNNSDNNNPSVSGMGGQLQSLLNGGDGVADLKHSPVSHINNGTPAGGHTNPNSIQQQLGGGPASVHGCHGDPGSVQSQSGVGAPGSVLGNAGPNSQQPVQPHQTPTSESSQTTSMDFQPPAPATNSSGGDDEMEISKIKASLIEGFGPGSGSFGPV